MRYRIHVPRHVFTHQGEPVRRAEITEPRPRIVSAGLLCSGRIVRVEETMKKRAYRDRRVTLPTPDDGSLEAELEVLRRPEGKHLRMHPWISRDIMAL